MKFFGIELSKEKRKQLKEAATKAYNERIRKMMPRQLKNVTIDRRSGLFKRKIGNHFVYFS
jgi:hypothetical protein